MWKRRSLYPLLPRRKGRKGRFQRDPELLLLVQYTGGEVVSDTGLPPLRGSPNPDRNEKKGTSTPD